MDYLSPLFSIVVYIIAFGTAYLIRSNSKIAVQNGRHESVDGLRGFLALGVFIHHSAAWGQYFYNGNWDISKSNLYSQFGQVSVSFFFMITSFLFTTRLLDSREKEFGWKNFFIGRAYRLVPMYYISVLLIVIIIMSLDSWNVRIGGVDFFISIAHWLLFTIFKTTHINGAQYTSLVNGGIQWSLWYEWLFYISLPLLSVFILKVKPKTGYLLFGIAFIVAFCLFRNVLSYHIYSFVGGCVAAVLLKFTSFHEKINERYKSILVLVCLILIVQFNTTSNVLCILLITVVFTLVAMDTSVFGILKNPTLKFLGEICYSTYLLHCILLYSVFFFGFTFAKIKQYSPVEYCVIIFSIVPALIAISFLSYKYIEKPFIEKGKRIVK